MAQKNHKGMFISYLLCQMLCSGCWRWAAPQGEKVLVFIDLRVARMAFCMLVRSYLCVSLYFACELIFFLLLSGTPSSMFLLSVIKAVPESCF